MKTKRTSTDKQGSKRASKPDSVTSNEHGEGFDYIEEDLWPLARPIDTLKPDPANVRAHGERNKAEIRASLAEFKQRLPVVVREATMTIEAGNGRWSEAKALGWTHIAAVVVDDDALSAMRFAIMDNRSAELAEWEDGDLTRALEAIREEAGTLSGTGFDMDELDEMIAKQAADVGDTGTEGEDDAHPPAADPVTVVGDLWVVGGHRVLCGDCTDVAAVDRLMGGGTFDVMFTDMPYGVKWEHGKFQTHNKVKPENRFEPIKNDDLQGAELRAFTRAYLDAVRPFGRPSFAWYIFTAPLFEGAEVLFALREAGWHVQAEICWDKLWLVQGRSDYKWKHEKLWYGFVKDGDPHLWNGGNGQTTVWDDIRRIPPKEHPTQKPPELAERALHNSSPHGGAVLDPFGGSGSTAVAAVRTGRRSYTMELDPGYVDTIVARLVEATGEPALLEGDGRTFGQVKKGRR